MEKITNEFGRVFGYVRVSTKEQNTDRQTDDMLAYGVLENHIFIEKQSGKNFNRPMYKKLIRLIRKGDIIVIKSIDRLGRNYQDIIDQWRMITQDIGCGIHVIDMPTLNTSGDPTDLLSKFITDMMLQVLSFVAENERENTIKRQKEGIEAAKRRGNVKLGRPRTKIPFEFWNVYVSWKTGEVKATDLIKYCHKEYGICQRTFYRRIRELDQRFGDVPPSQLKDFMMDEYMDGFSYDAERADAALGYFNPYTNSPEQKKKIKEARQRAAREEKEDEEELRRIILEKRQAEFRSKFGIEDTPIPDVSKRGRKPPTTHAPVKTTIID